VCFVTVLLVGPVGAQSVCPFPGFDDEEKCQNQFEIDITGEDYEADGTDTDSDRDIFQEALDDAAACASICGGATVFIPPGTYYVGENSIGSNVTLRGQGMGLSILKLDDDYYEYPILANENVSDSNIYIRDLTIDGEDGESKSEGGLLLSNVDSFTVTRCEFKNSDGDGLRLRNGSQNGLINGCIASQNGENGFSISKGTGDDPVEVQVFSDCISESNDDSGFSIVEAQDVILSGCIASENGTESSAHGVSGFHVDSSQQVAHTNCIAEGNGRGFQVYTSESSGAIEDISFSGCTAFDNEMQGFLLVANGGTIRGVTLTACHAHSNGDRGFYAFANGGEISHFSIAGGTVIYNVPHGIHVRGAQYGGITGVTIMNNSSDQNAYDAGIFINDGASSASSKHITISGCMIGDDQDTAEQNYAIRAVGSSDRIHILANDVEENIASEPISLPTCVGDNLFVVEHNPGSTAAGCSLY